MLKRKVEELNDGVSKVPVGEPRRSSRRISTTNEAPETSAKAIPTPKKSKKTQKSTLAEKPFTTGSQKESAEAQPQKVDEVTKSTPQPGVSDASPAGRQFWLMKAEPESRLEKGHDVKFSIDDLAAKSEPEPWDGIRNYAARNNLRAMKKGDLAFFYHSSCKIPAIVGIMEIVQEHSPDLSAHDPAAPYHDPSSKPENPKWSVVHVKYRQKLSTPITLKELKEWQREKGHPLESMQMLKMTRMSVSKVSSEEWDFLIGEMKKNGDVIMQ